MSLLRRWLAFIVTAIVIGGFGASLALAFLRSVQEVQLVASSVRSTAWSTGQAGVEFHRLMDAVNRFRLQDPEITAADVVLRFELFYSRIPVLDGNGEYQAELMAESFGPEVRTIADGLAGLEPSFARLDELSIAERTELRDQLLPLWPPLHEIMQAMITFSQEDFRQTERDTLLSFWLSFAGMLLGGLALVWLLVYRWQQATQAFAQLKLTGDALARSEAQFRQLVIDNGEGVIILDGDRKPLFVNPACADILGPDDGEAADAGVRAVVGALSTIPEAGRLSGVAELEVPSTDGRTLILQARESRTCWDGRDARMVTIADVTALRAAQLKTMHQSRLLTLGEMATAVAHELNQPLTVASMAAQNAQEELAAETVDQRRLGQKLKRILAQITRARSIIDHMRIFGRQGSEERVVFDLYTAITGALSLVGEQLRSEKISIRTNGHGPPALVRGSRIQMEQVLVNLLVNARDAVQVRREREGVAIPGLVEVSVGPVGEDEWRLTVADNGCGISPEILPRVFEPFVTDKPVGKGTGLGLSIAFGIVRDMGGRMSVVSDLLVGAAIAIVLPRVAQQAESTVPQAVSEADPRLAAPSQETQRAA